MSDFLDSILSENEVIARDVTIGDTKGTAYFRHLTGAERTELAKGQVFEYRKEGDTAVQTMKADAADSRERDFKLLWFTVCREDGSRYFKSLADVKKAPDHKLEPLLVIAREINNHEGDDAKKS